MLRYRAAELLDRVRLPRVVMSLRSMAGTSPWITVLSYHRVAPASAAGQFEDGTVDVTPEAFDVHVAFAKKWFDIIGIDDLLSFARGGKLPKNPVLFTFDDGYLDNRKTALPILQKHGARATFFISTTYVSDRRLFWWDHLSYMVKRSTRERIEITYPTPTSLSLSGAGERRQAYRALRRFITEHVGIDIWRFLEVVGEATGVVLSREDERRFADEMILTWDDVKAMRAAGMDIQSHTCDHYVLPTLSTDHLRLELRRSREILEGVLNEPVRAISYPVGRGVVQLPTLREEVKRAGYELGFSNASGVNHRWDLDPLNVRRLSLDIDSPDSYFRTVMAVPYI
jgi:peptidoglycan/xylan/chitin deacetylase (PgdA/CDA1 family)